MAKQTINIGSIPNDGTGTTLRDGGDLINDNFNEIYTAIGNGTAITLTSTPTELNLLSGVSALVTTSTSDVFTNKSISGSTNTLSNIGNSSLSNSSISITGDDSSAQTISLGGGILFTGGSGITTSVSGNEITFTTDGSIVTETSTDTLTNKTISGSSNTLSNIGNSSLTNSAITLVDESSSTTTISLGESLKVNGGTGIDTTISGDGVSIAVDSTVVTESSTDTLTNKTINGPDNTLTNIANGSLANSTITIGDDAIALGGTQTTITNLSLDGSTGTINLTSSGNKIRFNFANTGALPSATDYQGMFASEAATAKAFFAEGGAWNEIVTENSSIGRLSNVDITSSAPTNGQILVFNSSNGRFEPGNQSAGSSLTIEEDGSALSTAATTVDFVGEGVTASGTGAEKTINIPGGATAMIDVTSNSASAYRFSSHYGTEDNPTIFTKQGQTIAFNLNGLAGSHPFVIQTSSGSTYTASDRITTGLTHIATDGTVTTGVSAQNKTSGILYFEVPYNQATVYYICASHGGMNGTLAVAKKEGGALLQQVNTQTGAVATGTTIFVEDDTIPQNTEGSEFMTLSITPKSATSVINIEAHIFYSQSAGTRSGAGLFKDSDANALSFTSNFIKDTTSMGNMQVFYSEASGSTSARTYKIRCGNIQTAGTFTFNGQGGVRKFGGTVLSTIRILEIEA